uniref:Prolyl endopeptidase n=1 Tax=Ditylenchus dipsaci TaxID=166011 RepID=A0A915CRN5_9BILA
MDFRLIEYGEKFEAIYVAEIAEDLYCVIDNKGVHLSNDMEKLPGQLFIDSRKLPVYQKLCGVSWQHYGKTCAYQLRQHESNYAIIKFRCQNGEDLPDTINRVLYWKCFVDNVAIDSNTAKSINTKTLTKLYYHKMGTDSDTEDVPVQVNHQNEFIEPTKEMYVLENFILQADLEYGYKVPEQVENVTSSIIEKNGRIRSGSYVRIFGDKLTAKYKFELQTILPNGLLTALTNHEAPNKKLIETTVEDAHNPTTWYTLIKEDSERCLINSTKVRHTELFVLSYREKWRQESIYLYHYSKKQLLAKLNPPDESVTWCSVTATHIYFGTSSWLKPKAFYSFSFSEMRKKNLLDVAVKKPCNQGLIPSPLDFSAESECLNFGEKDELLDWTKEFEVKQMFYRSGLQMIPIEVIQPKNIVLEGSNPTILTAYGGYGRVMPISLDQNLAVFLKHFGGVVAIAHVRGGGYPVVSSVIGKDWHKQGIRDNQQNSFDDFAAAAQYLIKMKYTNPRKLAGMGGSKGGLLMTVCARQYPWLFQALVADSGVYDIIHLQRDRATYPEEYGDPANEADFRNALSYSPLHNIETMTEQWPSMLLLAGALDVRAKPFHTLKYIATLYEHLSSSKNFNRNPVLAKVCDKRGHFYRPEERTIFLSFLQKELGLKYSDE